LIGKSIGNNIHKVSLTSGAEDLPGVISGNNLDYVAENGDQFFVFWGCHPHDCGGMSGAYTFDVFQISSHKMMVFDVRQCDIPSGTEGQPKAKMCVTNVKDPESTPASTVQHLLAGAISSAIPDAEGVPIDF